MTEASKHTLTAEIVQSVMKASRLGPDSVSVAFEEVPASRWRQDVFRHDLLGSQAQL